jgi:hypothetical protein
LKCFEAADQSGRLDAFARPKKTHYDEMNDRIFNIDMNG